MLIRFRHLLALPCSAALITQGVQGAPVPNTEYANSTLVIYNTNVDESRSLAAFYVKSRGLSPDLVVGLDCPTKETITRSEYDETIAKPLRAMFSDRKWWELEAVGGGASVAKTNKIKIVALMYGMPMRVAPTPPPPTGEVDPKTGKPKPPPPDYKNSDGASVDSELAILGMVGVPLKSFGRNLYYNSPQPFSESTLGSLMLVGRIDGPDFETAKRLITDAIEVEKTGLWGSVWIDLARMELSKGPGYEEGDKRLRNVVKIYEKAGFPVAVETRKERIPMNYPMGEDVIGYFGWYVYHSDGPFRHGDFRFKKGAVAAHLHSYSATSIKSTTNYWVGPLVSRGAAAVLGTVYEPFLTLTTNYDLFNARLLAGYTFIEAAWMATMGVSWMNVMVGDPLYQPFRYSNIPKMPDADFKAFRIAVMRWGEDTQRDELVQKLELAGTKMKSGKIHEGLGLRLLNALKPAEAQAQFEKAKALYTEKVDKLRVEMHLVDIMRNGGKKPQAIAKLRGLVDTYKDIPEHKAAQTWLNVLDPPPPPPPPKK